MATSFTPAPPPFVANPCHQQLSSSARPFFPSRVVLVRWTPPPCGWFKLNFDGSVYDDSRRRASIGGVIRDSAGRVVASFAVKTEHETVGVVEARALVRGLQIALRFGVRMIVAEGDDLVLVQLLRGEETQTRIPTAMQEEIAALLRCFAGCDVRHVYREGNSVAHALCRQAYECPGVWLGTLVPSTVYAKILEDQNGAAHPRVIPSRASKNS